MMWLSVLVVVMSLVLAIGARASAAPSRAELFAAVASIVGSVLTTAYLLTAPVYATQRSFRSTGSSSAAQSTVTVGSSTFVQVEGWAVVLPMLVFVVVSAIPFLFWRSPGRVYAELGSAGALGALSFLSGFSIGQAYAPSAVLTLLAGTIGRTRRRE